MTRREVPLRFGCDLGPAEAFYSSIRARVANESAATTNYGARILVALLIASLAAIALILAASQIWYREAAAGLMVPPESTTHLLFVLCSVVALTIAATLVAVRRGRLGLGSGLAVLAPSAVFVPPVYAALILMNPVHAGDPAAFSAALSPWGLRCLTLATLIGMVVLASCTVALRGSVLVAGRFRAASLGAAAGAWSGLSVFIFCPAHDLKHLLVGHALPVALFTIAGAVAVPRFLQLAQPTRDPDR